MIVFDIDSTLTVMSKRIKYVKSDFLKFESLAHEDKPNGPVVMLYNQLKPYHDIRLVTGRNERVRKETLEWIKEHVDRDFQDHHLYMRGNNDRRPDYEVKYDLVKDWFHHITVVFEDRDSVVKMWRDLGIATMQVNYGDF